MDVKGDNTLVKVLPIEDRKEKETYPHGLGVAQWRLNEKGKQRKIPGTLLYRIPAGGPLPWVQ